MSVASKRLNGPLAVAMDTITVATAVLVSAAAVSRPAGARQMLLALFIKITPCSPLLARSHQHV